MAGYVEPVAQLVVEVFVRDIRRSREFYERLGFRLVEDKQSFVGLVWEEHQFFLDEREGLPPLPDFPQANVRVMVPDVDALWRRCRELGARVISPIADRDYGLRDFTVADPDGFGLRFATRLPETP